MKQTHFCMFNHELLVMYVAHNVASSERVEVERHLAQCAECRREIKELEQSWLALDIWNEDVESARPRINDLRLRLKAAQSKPSLREMLRKRMEIFSIPWRLVPASPVLAVIITGIFVFIGLETEWDSVSTPTPIQPSFASNTNNAPVPEKPIPKPALAEAPKPAQPINQIKRWNSLVQNSNLRSRGSSMLIRMATDGLDYVHFTNFPSKDSLSGSNNTNLLHPVSMRVVSGETVRLE